MHLLERHAAEKRTGACGIWDQFKASPPARGTFAHASCIGPNRQRDRSENIRRLAEVAAHLPWPRSPASARITGARGKRSRARYLNTLGRRHNRAIEPMLMKTGILFDEVVDPAANN